MAKSYRDLVAWQKAMGVADIVYTATEDMPRNEMFGLTMQMRRAAVSIASNIAEGQARYSKREFVHFLRNARGSLAELETQVLLAAQLGYLHRSKAEQILKATDELNRILAGLIDSMRREE